MKQLWIIIFLATILQAQTNKVLHQVSPKELCADIQKLNDLLQKALEEKAWPGGVLLAARDGKIFFHRAFGYHSYQGRRAVKRDDLFDLASITKVVATTSSIMKLYEKKAVNLKAPVVFYFSDFADDKQKQKTKITISHLLSHSSGLPAHLPIYKLPQPKRWPAVFQAKPVADSGTKTIYSDLGFLILGKLVEKQSGKSLDQYAAQEIFIPLAMKSTKYNPETKLKNKCLPTERNDKGEFIQGYVHDEKAHSLGGIAGHAGLFSTAMDLAIFSQMMLNGGQYDGKRIFQTETVKLFTRRAGIVAESSRCLGWDSPSGQSSGGIYLSEQSFGHTGFTGTSLWIDPRYRIIVILLTNAVHPERSAKNPRYYDWRQIIHSAVYQCFSDTKKNPQLQSRKSGKH